MREFPYAELFQDNIELLFQLKILAIMISWKKFPHQQIAFPIL